MRWRAILRLWRCKYSAVCSCREGLALVNMCYCRELCALVATLPWLLLLLRLLLVVAAIVPEDGVFE